MSEDQQGRRDERPDGVDGSAGDHEPPDRQPPDADQPTQDPQALAFIFSLHQMTPRVRVTPAIVGICGAVYLAMVISGMHPLSPTSEGLIRWGANFGPMTGDGQWWRLLTSTFIHIGIIHILMNMWVLWSAGLLMERLLGHGGFIVLYVLSGLLGALASMWWNPVVVSAGASGAVFGVYGGLLAFMVRRRDAIPMSVLRGLLKGTLLFVGFNLVFGLMHPQIDMAAHVGGLVGGFLVGLPLSHDMSPGAWRRRWRRNVMLALGGAALVAGGALMVPSNLGQFIEAQNHFIATEKVCQKTYTASFEKAKAGKLTDAELADILRDRVIRPWKEARDRLDRLEDLPRAIARRHTLMLRYAGLRQEGWELMAQALRDNDRDRADRSNRKHREAEQVLKELNAGAKKP